MRISVVFQVDAIKDILSCDRRFEEISLRKNKLRMRTKSVKLHYHCLHYLVSVLIDLCTPNRVKSTMQEEKKYATYLPQTVQ